MRIEDVNITMFFDHDAIESLKEALTQDLDLDDEIDERISVYMETFDVEEYTSYDTAALNLLEQYRPGNGCTLGDSFTSAVEKAFAHLIQNPLFANEIKDQFKFTVSYEEVTLMIRAAVQNEITSVLATELSKIRVEAKQIIASIISEAFSVNKAL